MSRVYRNEKPVVDVNQWFKNPNGSIFIKYIPNHITKTDLRDMFNFLGVISRIDVVNIASYGGGSGRRAFIHFTEWKQNEDSLDIRSQITHNYPRHTQVMMDSFEYSVTLNSRPIPSTELNTQQLSDWCQRLNDELVDFKATASAEIESVKAENAELRKMISDNQAIMNFNRYETTEKIAYIENKFHAEFTFMTSQIMMMIQSYEADYEDLEKHIPSEIPGLTMADLNVMDEFAEEIEREADRTHGEQQYDENNMYEIETILDANHHYAIDLPEEGEIIDLDSVEAGLRRPRDRDSLIFKRGLHVR